MIFLFIAIIFVLHIYESKTMILVICQMFAHRRKGSCSKGDDGTSVGAPSELRVISPVVRRDLLDDYMFVLLLDFSVHARFFPAWF